MQKITMNNYNRAKYMFFRWRYSLTLLNKLGLAFGMAIITGLMAQVRIYLPFTPVPITGQVFAVLLSGVVCGGIFGSISQLIYIGLGIAGISWFAAFSPASGNLFFSPTGGYLIGFMLAPLLIGYYTDRHVGARGFLPQIKIMMLGVAIIHFCGALVLGWSMRLSPAQALLLGAAPFILVDLFKAALVALISWTILPRVPYNEEADKKE